MSTSNGTLNGTTDRGWTEAKECPICQHKGWCQVSADGELAQCMREPRGAFKVETDKNGADYYLHRLKDSLDFGRPPSKPKPQKPSVTDGPERADPDILNRVYQATLGRLDLSKLHREALNRRGLDDDAIEALGYRSLRSRDHRKHAEALAEQFGAEALVSVPGFFRDQHGPALVGMDGLAVPVRDLEGRIVALKVRLDKPMKAGGKYAYLSSKKKGGPGPGSPVHIPLGTTKPCPVLRVTEGELKADIAGRLSGLPTISVPGVGNWRKGLETAKALESETVRVSFDADATSKKEVATALLACCKASAATGIAVEVERWPMADGKGIDDVLAAGKAPAVLQGRDAMAEVEKLAESHGVETGDTDGLSVLERGRAVLAEGGADALYDERNRPLLNDLAHADPAELARFKADLKAAGLSVTDFSRVVKSLRGKDAPPPIGPQPNTNGAPEPLPITDLSNGERLARRHGKDLRYCHQQGIWYHWTGTHWAKDENGEVWRRGKETARSILLEAYKAPTDGLKAALTAWQADSEKRERLAAMIFLAQSEPGIPITPDEMNRDGWLLNCLNGTIDLHTGELRPHRREDMITSLCRVRYDSAAECPNWMATLQKFFAGKESLIDYVQRVFGYCLVGEVRDAVVPICYGTGANGKSTILGTFMDVLGPDLAMKAPHEMLMAQKYPSHPTDKADLFGKRLVLAIESEKGKRLNESLIKELSGGDKIRARHVHKDFFEFTPSHTLLMATNHKPKVKGTDEGIWRRLRLVPFSVKVEGKNADTSMPSRLRKEHAGILAWAVRGCLEWQRRGLEEPEAVSEATEEYRDEQDVLGAFFKEHCTRHHAAKVKASNLYARYKEWARDAEEYVVSLTEFGIMVQERGFEKKASNGIWYLGIGLQEKPVSEADAFTVTATAAKSSGNRERGEL